ncbi:TPA: aldo/keto reductase, partial [Candidatus Latescibacteria bacterium]|nr:aldo/keto reductase [Candidatus Latescibacterota bacterium]
MDYTNFGSAGVKVSRIALGLGLRGQGNETEAQKLVEHAIASGINFIDCANIYGPNDDRANIGRSEVVAGKAIADKRDQIILTSKVCG